MTHPHSRKRDQAVVFEGTLLPRGHDVGRPCDRSGCGREAAELVGQDGGSILFVCVECASSLTRAATAAKVQEMVAVDACDTQEIPAVSDASEQPTAVEGRGSVLARVPAPCWWFLVGVVMMVVGLNMCAYTSSDGLGRGFGIAGGIVAARCLVPRYRR